MTNKMLPLKSTDWMVDFSRNIPLNFGSLPALQAVISSQHLPNGSLHIDNRSVRTEKCPCIYIKTNCPLNLIVSRLIQSLNSQSQYTTSFDYLHRIPELEMSCTFDHGSFFWEFYL